MPDCDKFERKIGKPWRNAYRLAGGNGALPDQALVGELIKASTQEIRSTFDFSSAEVLREAIFEALAPQPPLPLAGVGDRSLTTRQRFIRKLEEIQKKSGNSVGSQAGVKVAKLVFDELNAAGHPVTIKHVEKRFSEQFFWLLIDNSFLSRVRDGLMKGTGRTCAQEDEWETELRSLIEEKTSELMSPVFKGKDSKAIRQKRSSAAPQKWHKDQLHEPVPVQKE